MARVGEATTPDPGSVPDPGVQPPDATVQAQTTPPPVETVPTPETKGPIPFDRHESILKNARTKTEQEVSQRFQQEYADHLRIGKQIQADPVGAVVQLVSELTEHPEYGGPVISALARALGARRGQRPPVEADADAAPEADLQTTDGTRVYSAEQLAKREAWFQKQMLSQVDQRLSPLQQREQAAQAREKHDAAVKDANARMSKVLEPFKALPEFKEHRTAIAEKTKALMAEGHEPQVAIGLAFSHVLRDVVMPSRAAQSRNELVAQAVAKSTGSTTVPGTAPAAPAKRPQSMSEAFSSIQF